jgi:hypothetical protein
LSLHFRPCFVGCWSQAPARAAGSSEFDQQSLVTLTPDPTLSPPYSWNGRPQCWAADQSDYLPRLIRQSKYKHAILLDSHNYNISIITTRPMLDSRMGRISKQQPPYPGAVTPALSDHHPRILATHSQLLRSSPPPPHHPFDPVPSPRPWPQTANPPSRTPPHPPALPAAAPRSTP